MKVYCIAILTLSLFLHGVNFVCAAGELTPQQVLQKADEARGSLEGIEWEVSIASTGASRFSKMVFYVKARGFDVSAVTISPKRYKGDKALLVNGNRWYYASDLGRAIPIARRQQEKHLWEISDYVDIVTTNYVESYEPKALKEESVNGVACYVYDLTAKSSDVSYGHIRYWISKDNLLGVQAKYFAATGKRTRWATMEYDNQLIIKGERRPFISRIKIRDDGQKNKVIIFRFKEPVIGKIPNYVFNPNFLKW